MSTPFSRSRLARFLGVTPARVSQMQTEGRIAKAEIELDEKTNVWPATYAESLIGKRSGRQVSESIYGFLPPADPAKRVDDALVQIKDDWCFAQKFVTPSGVMILASLLSRPSEATLPGLAPRNAYTIDVSDRVMVELMKAVAELLLGGDVFAAAWAWWSDQGPWDPDLKEIVLIDEGLSQPKPLRGPQPAPVLRVESNNLSYTDLAGKLGRPVPLFPQRVAVPSVVEYWQASGRRGDVEVVFDTNYLEQSAACASLIKGMPGLSEDQQGIACRSILRDVNWEQSGKVNPDPWRFVCGVDQEGQIESLATIRQPDVSHYRKAIGDDLLDGESSTLETIQGTMDTLSDLNEFTYGKFGDAPDYRAAFAIREALGSLRRESDLLDFDNPATLKNYRAIRDFEPERARLWHEYRKTLRPMPADRRKTPAVRELEAIEVYAQAGPSQMLEDPSGIPVRATPTGWRDEISERLHVAVPVTNKASNTTLGKDFAQIRVAPDTQQGPVFIRTPRGLQVMPMNNDSTAGYTHGYGGAGPSNLASAIGGFLNWVTDSSITDQGRQRLWSIIVSASQGQELIIERENILGAGSVHD